MIVEFIKEDKVNGTQYKVGDTLSVGESWYKTLNENGSVKDFIEPVVVEKKAKANKEEA